MLRSNFLSFGCTRLNRIARPVVNLDRIRSKMSANSAQVMEQSFSSKTDSRVATTINIDLGDCRYPIYIGLGLLDELDLLQRGSVLLGFQYYLVLLSTTVIIPTALGPQIGGGNVKRASA